MTIAVLGVITATAVPLFTQSDSFAVSDASKQLESDIQYAQNLATSTGDAYGFRTISGDNIHSNYEIYNVDTDDPVSSPYDHEPMQEDFSENYGNTIFVTDNHDIQFDETGMPTIVAGGDTIQISNDDGTETSTIEVVESTGMIRIQ